VDPVVQPAVVYSDDARVVQAGRRTGLPAESFNERVVAVVWRREHLDRDLPAEQAVLSLVDTGHPAATEYRPELVAVAQDQPLLGHS